MKFALVGAGSMAKNYLKTLENMRGAKITLILAKTYNNLKTLPSKYHKTTEINDLLNRKFDGIILSTPASTHFKLAAIFLKQGFNVLVEKPLTTNLKDALRLKKIKSKAKLMVGHTLLFHPAYKALKQQLKKQKIISIDFEGYNNNPRSDTNLLWDWGPHPASIFLDLLSSFPTKILAKKFKEDEIVLRLEFKKSIEGNIKLGWNSKAKIRRLLVKTKEKIFIFDDMKNPKLEVRNSDGLNNFFPKIERNQPLEEQLAEFLKLIRGGKVISNLDFGIKVVKFLEFCQKIKIS